MLGDVLDEEDEDTGVKVPYVETAPKPQIEKPKEIVQEPKKTVITYPFLLRKIPEYENSKMYLVGSMSKLGNWDVKNAVPMDEELRNDQVFYSKYLEIKESEFPFEYKYFYIKNNQPVYVNTANPHKSYLSHPQFFRLYHKIKKSEISIYDLNIRYFNHVDEKNIWDFRKEKMVQSILNSYVDILFFQEITHIQFEVLEYNLGSVYEFIGVYRDTTDASEKCCIGYNRFKYTLNDWGQFWLSSTPYSAGSNDFRQFFPRICTWASLRQINGVDFIYFNTHLDHVNFDSHIPAINVVLEELEKILPRYPSCKAAFLGGCFYCEEDDPVITKIKADGFREVMFGNTFHDFTGEADHHWDYLFWKDIDRENSTVIELKEAFVAKKEGTVDEVNRVYISDHYPVFAQFEVISAK